MTPMALAIGSLVGFVGSMPVAGPVSATVVKQGLEGRFSRGLRIALGGALAKGFYAALAVWGFDAVLKPYPLVKPLSLLIAALFLLALGVSLLRAKKRKKTTDGNRGAEPSGVLMGLSMTLANPAVMATFTAVTAVLHARGWADFSGVDALLFGLGTTAGMLLWYKLLLSGMRRFLRPGRSRLRVSQAMGVFVIAASGWFLLGAVQGLASCGI